LKLVSVKHPRYGVGKRSLCNSRGIVFLTLLATLALTGASASEIYHWVDKDGVAHYSQFPPPEDTADVSKKKLEAQALPGNSPTEDVYNVKEHERRMAQWRKERDQRRQDAREEKSQPQPPPVRYPEPYNGFSRSFWYPPIYHRPPYRPPHRPPNRPQPPVVIPRPPSVLLPNPELR